MYNFRVALINTTDKFKNLCNNQFGAHRLTIDRSISSIRAYVPEQEVSETSSTGEKLDEEKEEKRRERGKSVLITRDESGKRTDTGRGTGIHYAEPTAGFAPLCFLSSSPRHARIDWGRGR